VVESMRSVRVVSDSKARESRRDAASSTLTVVGQGGPVKQETETSVATLRLPIGRVERKPPADLTRGTRRGPTQYGHSRAHGAASGGWPRPAILTAAPGIRVKLPWHSCPPFSGRMPSAGIDPCTMHPGRAAFRRAQAREGPVYYCEQNRRVSTRTLGSG